MVIQSSKHLRRKRKPERNGHIKLTGFPRQSCPRKCKASRRWKKAQQKISKLKKKFAQQRQNWVHHQAVEIVSSNSLIATEKLNSKI